MEPSIQESLAVLPHATGVRTIVGVPRLSLQQRVDIPKDFAREPDMGCMPLGTGGENTDSDLARRDGLGEYEYFIPDSIYGSEKIANYTGPEIFQTPLSKAADALREYIPIIQRHLRAQHPAEGVPSNVTNNHLSGQEAAQYILGNCTIEFNQILNVTIPLRPAPELQQHALSIC
ncbi:hypothetical protein CPB84DRAFT_1964745 [Gymnopilus junonius]|uniref:Uncharacterized protein n=1 Tax=Gymnopilus junonius TaxID=109634 RepID=A0A9P5NEH1_GYMJU|nr:hypothetical protein CPB84DRAFT_1964745 [Gymnopilus junonius]